MFSFNEIFEIHKTIGLSLPAVLCGCERYENNIPLD